MGHFLDNGYDIFHMDGDLGISVWQHILEIFITPSVYASPISPAGGNFGCNLCGTMDLTKQMAHEGYLCNACVKSASAYQSTIINFLNNVLKRRSVSFQQLVWTRFQCLGLSVTLLDFITLVASGRKYKVHTTLVHKTARLVAKYYYQYVANISTEQISMLLYLTVAQFPLFVSSSIETWRNFVTKTSSVNLPASLQRRKGLRYYNFFF